jgi:ABC-type Na+ efflux pump permease subunit
LMRAALLIASKDLRSLLRDHMALFWVVAFPLGFALFFGSVMKAGVDADAPPISIALVLDSARPEALAFGEAMLHAGLHVQRLNQAKARDAVRRGDAVAYVRIADPAEAPIELGIDPSRRADAALLLGVIQAALLPPSAAVSARIHTTQVAREQHGPRTGFEIVFPAMLIWGLLGCVATFAVSLVSERNSGTLLRLRAAPISLVSILGGKSLACASACLGDVLLLSVLGVLAFGVRIDDLPKYALAVLACTVCFSGLTMAMSVLGKTEQAVAGAGWATLIVFAMLGGAMVPLSIMPGWLLSWSDASPVKWGIIALEGATWRDLRWSELWKPLGLLAGGGLASFSAGVWVLVARREV